jgi:lipopolysaccharide export system protein LptA
VRFTIERIRTLVLVAGVLLLAALGVFLARAKWKNLLSRHDLPQRLAQGIVQEANGYTFVHAFGAHSQYRIHASKEVQLKNDRIELHDVQIDLYGEDGSRIDRIAGDTFEYDQKTGLATAQGPVEMLLTRPAAAPTGAGKIAGRAIAELNEAAGSVGQIDVKTSGVTFDRNTGLVTTGEHVNFSTAQGDGSALGAKYDSQGGYLTLEQAVELTTHRGGDQVQVRAQHAEFDRGAQTCWMEKASAETRGGRADAAQARIVFRADGSAERMDVMGGFALQTATGGHLTAPAAWMEFDEHNQPRTGHMEGGVTMDSAKEGRTMHGTSPTAELAFTAEGLLKSAHLERGVEMRSDEASQEGVGQEPVRVSRTWRSPVLDINFRRQKRKGEKEIEPETMRGSGGAVVTSESQRGNAAATPQKMTADEVTGIFEPGSVLRAMTGVGHAEIEKTAANGARQTASGDRLQAEFTEGRDQRTKGPMEQETKGAKEQGDKGSGARGGGGRNTPGGEGAGAATGVESAELDGHVVLFDQQATKAGARPSATGDSLRATAGKAVYEDEGGWLHLTINPRVENGGLEMTADKVDVSQQSGDAFARGNVKATWTNTGARGTGGQAAAANSDASEGELTLGGKGPAHVVAEEAHLNESTGEVTFRGHARLWQESNFVSGPAVVLNQHLQTLVAKSNDLAEPVRVVMLSASGPGPGKNGAQARNQNGGGRAGDITGAPSLIRVRGGDLWYSDPERRAVMRRGALSAVVAETGEATSSSNEVELKLMPAGNHEGSGGGQAQVDQMTATGHVVLTLEGRRGTGETLAYSGATGEYVLTGTAAAPPKMTDPERGSVSGEALIFHSRDDSVSIEGGGRETITETTAPRVHGK